MLHLRTLADQAEAHTLKRDAEAALTAYQTLHAEATKLGIRDVARAASTAIGYMRDVQDSTAEAGTDGRDLYHAARLWVLDGFHRAEGSNTMTIRVPMTLDDLEELLDSFLPGCKVECDPKSWKVVIRTNHALASGDIHNTLLPMGDGK